MSLHLQREIGKLKNRILALGARVEENLHRAVRSIQQGDQPLASQVVEEDRLIDQIEVEIEEECLKVLALHQPVAHDLRFIIAVLKINNDLERIGDHAVNIAERGLYLIDHGAAPLVPDFSALADKVRKMVRESLDALVNKDPELARQVWVADDDVDDLNRHVCAQIQAQIADHPDKLQSLLYLLNTSRGLERVADHATNIAKDVIYMVNGEIVRHSGEEAKLPPDSAPGA